MSDQVVFDPYALFEALDRERVSYVVVGGFARVVHGSGETTRGLDIVPSLRPENLRRLARALEGLGGTGADGGPIRPDELVQQATFRAETRAGSVTVVPTPWGTRGYDDIRIRGNRENIGRGIRPHIASLVDLTRMLEASSLGEDRERLQRLRRLMELERQRTRRPGRSIER
jgi:hypothetical protein